MAGCKSSDYFASRLSLVFSNCVVREHTRGLNAHAHNVGCLGIIATIQKFNKVLCFEILSIEFFVLMENAWKVLFLTGTF